MNKKEDIQQWALEELKKEQEKATQWSEPVYSEGYKVEMEVHKPNIWNQLTHRQIRITDMRDRHPETSEELDMIN